MHAYEHTLYAVSTCHTVKKKAESSSACEQSSRTSYSYPQIRLRRHEYQ